MPDPAPDSPLARARARIAIEHALRGERARRVDLEARLSRAEQESAGQRQTLTVERDALNTALSREQEVAAESSRQLDAARAQVNALDAELGSVRRELRDSSADGDALLASLQYERALLASLRRKTESEAEQLVAQINSLYQKLDHEREVQAAAHQKAENEAEELLAELDGLYQKLAEARSANQHVASSNTARMGSQEDAEEHKSKKKLRRELSEAQAQIENQKQQIERLQGEKKHDSDLLNSYRQEVKGLHRELDQSRTALELEKVAGRKVATAIVETKLKGTGVSYPGALNGDYNASRDSLALTKQDELRASADLARWQVINSKRQTARGLDTNKSIEEQASEAAIAARWTLLSNPPKALRWRPAWAMWGFVLDDQSEKYLLEQSAEALMEMTLAVPKKERRLGRL